MDSGQRTAGSGQRAADSGQRAADSGQRAAGCGQRTADSGQQAADSESWVFGEWFDLPFLVFFLFLFHFVPNCLIITKLNGGARKERGE